MINFITITNNGYKNFADSQIENFSKEFLSQHKLTVYCSDSESFSYHSTKSLPSNVTIEKLSVEIDGRHSYLQGRFKELMKLKFPLILNCLEKYNSPVWFIDNDLLFFSNPEPHLDYSKDILFQADMGDFPSRYGWVCTGCFWVNNTKNSISLLSTLIDLQSNSDRGEQELLNDYCKSWPPNANCPDDLKGSILDFPNAKMDILPYYLFQNGYLAFKQNQYNLHKCVMIHFNHETNYNTKLKNFMMTKNNYER